MLNNYQNYGFYQELVKTGKQTVYASEINDSIIDTHFENIIAILDDGIETDFVQHMKIHVVFRHGECDLYIFQYLFNLIFWPLITASGKEIDIKHIIFEPVIKTDWMIKYINKFFIRKNLKRMDRITINQMIDRCINKFIRLQNFQMYLANSVDFDDTIELMEKFPEFNDTMHVNLDGINMQDQKEYITKNVNIQKKYITAPDSHHNQKYAFQTGEGTNPKQYGEVMVSIGPKPDGQGGLFKQPINHSFANGGLQSPTDIVIDSSIGRIAQIISKQNVGQSGAFARKLGLNNMDSFLNPDPSYVCDTKNFECITIKDDKMLSMFDMRFYKFTPDGIDHLLDAENDKQLIGQTLYFRSPITCASAARGEGICYRCYGMLAYLNNDINIGQIASEMLSSKYTQRMLSAKHLLEAAVVKMHWNEEMPTLFNVEFNQILLKDDFDYKKYRLIISMDDIIDDDEDDDSSIYEDEDRYVYVFHIRYPDGRIVDFGTKESDPIYITSDLLDEMNKTGMDDNGVYQINLSHLVGKGFFYVDIQNNELSKTMKQIKNLVDNESSIRSHDRDSILNDMIHYNLTGGIKINSVHFEVLISNQIRNPDDILETPDWSIPNTPYKLVTLETAITNSPRISVRLQGSKLKRTLTSPDNKKLFKASNLDLFAMERPQEFINQKLVDRSHDIPERKIINPVYFMDEDTGIVKNSKDTVTDDEVKKAVEAQIRSK